MVAELFTEEIQMLIRAQFERIKNLSDSELIENSELLQF
jgi:hypothetical protein